ncbi:MAG: sulfatase-like hydrolase/transferase, partial [Deltaproteobacteria bacterium]|nr:sulfatase-like hydrolase/transferase [Deltaproteobacteria bacterium]
MSVLLTRRAFLQGVLAGSASLAAGCSGLGFFSSKGSDIARSEEILARIGAETRPEELPNIVLILTDDLGYGDLGCFGSHAISTPHLDQMAREGARLTSFYASAPVCTPSRAGLLSGRYPIRTHMNDALLSTKSMMGTGHRLWGLTSYGIPEDELLLPEMLKQKGYQTALIGKWHLGDFSP